MKFLRTAKMRNILTYMICMKLLAVSSSGFASDIDDLIFKSGKFISPITIDLPEDLSEAQEANYVGKLGKFGRSSLPPLPPYQGQYSGLQPDLKGVLCALDMIKVVELPGFGGQGSTKHFRYTEKAPKNKTLILATRKLRSVDYKNCYEINPMGMGKREVCAQTFAYNLSANLKGAKLKADPYRGEAVAIKSPNTGKWGIETLKLSDPDRTFLLKEIARSLNGENKNRCASVGRSMPSDAGKSDRPSPVGPQSEWVGKWEGVEESWMELRQHPDGTFRIKIVTVEGETVVRGVPKGKVIEFYTIGGKKSIRFGNGEETGLKWLADKKECLIIAEGEGFCRR